jgi:hypothetical protein
VLSFLYVYSRYDTLVAGGGDGTLNELVVALIKHNAPRHMSVAQLPMGTANDLASATGISLVSAGLFRDPLGVPKQSVGFFFQNDRYRILLSNLQKYMTILDYIIVISVF